MNVEPMKYLRKRTDTMERTPCNTVNRNLNGSQAVHLRLRISIRRKFNLSYLLLISLVLMSNTATAQEIIVGKPLPSSSSSSSLSSSSSSISQSKSAAQVQVQASHQPRAVALNEWTPMPPSTQPKLASNNKQSQQQQPQADRRSGDADSSNNGSNNSNNEGKKDDKNSNEDLKPAATHYVGRQITDPGFYSVKHPDSKGYAFAYGADDFAHQERREGKLTVGEYSVALPDGRTQVVRYTSGPKAGFKADVSYQGEAEKESDTQQYQSFPVKSENKYLNQQSIINPSVASYTQKQVSTPYAEYIGPSPTPVYRQTRIKINGGPSPTPQSLSQSPSQSPIYVSYPIKSRRPSESPSLLYTKHVSPNPSPSPSSQPNVKIIDHHYYQDVVTGTVTPASNIYESDPNSGHTGPSLSPYVLKSSPSVETINRGSPLSFHPSPSPSPNSLLYGSTLHGAGPTKITTILQRTSSNINTNPQYTSLPTSPSPSEVPSHFKTIPRGFRAGPEFQPFHYSKASKSKRILIHGPGGSPQPYTADSSNIKYKESKKEETSPQTHNPHHHQHVQYSSSAGQGRLHSKVVVKPKTNLVPIEFFKAGPATKQPVTAGGGFPLLQEQSISQKQVYSPNTIVNNHLVSTHSPPLLTQAQEPQPQTYFEPEDALVKTSHRNKYSPLHPQGGPISSEEQSARHHLQPQQQLIRYTSSSNEQELQTHYVSPSQLPQLQPGQGQGPVPVAVQQQYLQHSVKIAPVKSSVATYTIGHLGVTPKPSLYHSSTDPGIPVGRPVHPSVGGLVYLENPNIPHTNPNIPISSSYSDELPDAGPTPRPTPKEQRKGVKEAISRLPFIPPFPAKTQTYKVGAPDFGEGVSYSSKPSSAEIIELHHHQHDGEGQSQSQGQYNKNINIASGDGASLSQHHYQHVQDLPSNQLSHHQTQEAISRVDSDQLLRDYYVQKSIEGAPVPNYDGSA